ncbi:hypothetical protein BGZ65_007431 [Modicella reniformis]|uniref:Amino acid transporter n=1 Tax=Modicella reniformis TaxID=1440133 RepID=A0A9P6SPY6_9FUNG|nr:hypothetical protein BGZ65_007431 [Modicella reniformis]
MTSSIPISSKIFRESSFGSSVSSSSSTSAYSAGQGNAFVSSCVSLNNSSSSSLSGNTAQQQDAAPERTMGLMSAVLMIIGTLIGTGIFASPGPLFDSVHCTQTSFMIWAFAGIVCTIGAFAYAELGTMFPESGGDFQYLARAYSKKVALVFGWCFITILNPIGTAGIAGVLGRYSVDVINYLQTGASTGFGGPSPMDGVVNVTAAAISVLNGTGYDVPHTHSPFAPGTPAYASIPKDPLPRDHTGAVLPSAPHVDDMTWVIRGFSIGAILLMGMINIFFKEGGKYASNILAVFKIAGMFMLIIIGSMQAVKNHAHSEALSIPIQETSHDVLDYVSALCFAFFAYNGFNNINLGLGELRDPERNLKRAVWIAMPFVTILFLLANFAFFSILSSHDLRHVHSLSLHAGHTVLGQPGGFLMAGTVIASALGSINANLWAGSRLLVIMAKDNAVVPFPVGKVWTRTGTQAAAILILMAQASFHAMLNLDFKTFSKIYSAVGWSWYGLSILGLLWLRKTKPNYPRPVKVYLPLAVGFVMVAFFLVFGSLTLSFTSSSKNQSAHNEEGGGGLERYKSVIMFGMVILFMTGVIPAFYLTRCYNRRRAAREGSTVTGAGVKKMEDDDEKQERRHSNASSVTLVGESKKRRDNKRSRSAAETAATAAATANQAGPSRPSSPQHSCDDKEEEVARVQALQSSRRDNMDDAEMGGGGGGITSRSLTFNSTASDLFHSSHGSRLVPWVHDPHRQHFVFKTVIFVIRLLKEGRILICMMERNKDSNINNNNNRRKILTLRSQTNQDMCTWIFRSLLKYSTLMTTGASSPLITTTDDSLYMSGPNSDSTHNGE